MLKQIKADSLKIGDYLLFSRAIVKNVVIHTGTDEVIANVITPSGGITNYTFTTNTEIWIGA